MDIELLESRENRLQELSAHLKSEFIGLDSQIDRIVENLKIWYVMPEILDRPVIINLWGMTGTGKTDLVRKIVSFLEYDQKFVELQMGSIAKVGSYDSHANTVRDLMVASDLGENEPNVILFDEFQRFRRIDESGKSVDDKSFDDIWMLLSDGKFTTETKGSSASYIENEIDDISFMIEIHEKEKKAENDEEAKSKREEEYKDLEDGVYKDYKMMIESPTEPSDLKLGNWEKKKYKMVAKKAGYIGRLVSYYDVLEMLNSLPDNFNLYAGQEYTKSLIFLCGNLDSAYDMSETMDADGDADILHNYSKRINIVTIKNCLLKLFKPEQIARFGNNHIIYPCLNKDSYRKLIIKTVDSFLDRVESNMSKSLDFSYDEDFVDLIYKNFVYPSQGTRPVFSGINSLLSATYPKILFKHYRNGFEGGVKFFVEDDKLKALYSNDDEIDDLKYNFDLDNIRSSISEDKKVLFSVHETGHALVYAHLFGYAPKQIKINLTQFDGAYVIPNEVSLNKNYLKKMIQVYLAGTLAEEIIFGESKRSIGCSDDLHQATTKAITYVRKVGFSGDLVKTTNSSSCGDGSEYTIDTTSTTDIKIQELIRTLTKETRELLHNNVDLLIEISDYVYLNKTVGGKEFSEKFGDKFGGLKFIDPLDVDSNDEIIDVYAEKFEDFKGKLGF